MDASGNMCVFNVLRRLRVQHQGQLSLTGHLGVGTWDSGEVTCCCPLRTLSPAEQTGGPTTNSNVRKYNWALSPKSSSLSLHFFPYLFLPQPNGPFGPYSDSLPQDEG